MPRSQPLLGILSQFRDEWPHGFKGTFGNYLLFLQFIKVVEYLANRIFI